MNRVLVRVWPVCLALVIVLLPSLGPLLDHHFAERQPYHAHLAADSGHEHNYQAFHSHPFGQIAESNPALPNLQISSAGAPMAILTEPDLIGRLMIGAGAVFAIPGAADSVLRSAYVPPPDKPLRNPIRVSVGL